MSHAPWSIAAVLFALVLGACSQRSLYAEAAPVPAGGFSQVSVVQGDALVVDGRRIHIIDAVTPQPAPDAQCPAEALAAPQARLRMTALAAQVRHVDVRPTGTIDKYNRADAHVLFDGADPAQVLIEEGLAVAPQKGAFSWCGPLTAAYPQAQRMAMLSLTGS